MARFLRNDLNKNKLKILKKIICLKTKQNTEMSDEEHSDSEFYYPEEHEMAEEC